jgi:hypothetical protein
VEGEEWMGLEERAVYEPRLKKAREDNMLISLASQI